MRRIDAIAITAGVFAAGAILYWAFKIVGFDPTNAGIWTQFILVIGLVGWILTYLYRALTRNMTYVQQLKEYEEAVMQKRYEEMTPAEREQLAQEVAAAKRSTSQSD
jgi:hypothetical protein